MPEATIPTGDYLVPGAELHSPNLKGQAKTHTPAISSIEQAVAIVDSLLAENKDRALKNNRIKSKYDSEKPYDQSRLTADGQSWKANISTRPLPMLIERIVPRFTIALKNMKFLTASALPGDIPGAAKKTELFRTVVTETCRAREGWEDFLHELSIENTLFGYLGVGNTGKWNWFPSCYSQIESFLVPTGTRHNAKVCQLAALKEKMLVHELFAVVEDMDTAKLAGWDVPEVLNSINTAVPESRRSKHEALDSIYVDLKRECSTIGALTATKSVTIWHVFVAEVDGRITHVAFDEESKKKLFWKSKQFEKMTDVVNFFSFQHGNGKLQGSKGVGRELYGMAGILDRARNEAIDRLMLSGKIVVTCPENQINRFRMSVVGSTILISNAYALADQKIESNIQEFFLLDQFLTDLLDQNAGSTSPKQLTGERVTKAAVELYAARDEERSDALLNRFLTQFARCMGTLQRRMCHPNCLEPDAKAAQARLLAAMTRQELDILANQPAISTVADLTDAQRKQVLLVTAEGRGNPLYNQHELEKTKIESLVNAELADRLLLPINDPSFEAEQLRLQQMENAMLLQGQKVPVSLRDGHEIHLKVLQQVVSASAQEAVQNPEAIQIVVGFAGHAAEHVAALEQANPKAAAPFKQWLNQISKTVQQLQELEAKTAAGEPIPGAPEPESLLS